MLATLNRKLSLALLVIMLSVGLAAHVLGQWGMRLYYEELTQKLNASIAMYVTDTHKLIEGEVGSKEALRMLANQTMILNPAVEVYLLDATGKILAHSLDGQALKRDRVELEPIREFIRGDAQFPIRGNDPRHDSVDKIFSASAISNDHGVQGYLYMILGGRLYDDISDQISWGHISKQMFWSLVIIVTSSMLVGFLIFHLLVRRLTRLTRNMTDFARSELGTDNLTPRVNRKSDEVDKLAGVFQTMSEKIHSQFEQLRDADRLRRELVSNVSHDLRTPLATMQAYLETLIIKDGSLSDRDRLEYLYSAEKGCHRLSRLIADLFELSKLEADDRKANFERFSIAELMYDILHGFELSLEDRELSLEVECPREEMEVYADIGMIQRVFDNLLRNAIAHTPKNGHILVRLSETEKGVNVTVEDTGRGIAKQDLPNIFQRYYQPSLSRAKQGAKQDNQGGIGLGLSIVKRILEIHGSQIEVSSQLNAGTCFRFTLPVAQRPPL
ncbi:MAG: ATP-binding protein [Endozoicomonas sp.]